MKVETSVYLVLEPQHDYRGQVTGIRMDRALTQPPKLNAKHIALKVNIAIDSSVFDQWIPEATLTISDGRVLMTPEVDVEAPIQPEQGDGVTGDDLDEAERA